MLEAYLRLHWPERNPEIRTGIYGDLPGNIERLHTSCYDLGIVMIEWADLDARLGCRSVGGWMPDSFDDIVANVRAHCASIAQSVRRASIRAPLVICFPTLPLPPVSYTCGWQASSFDLELKACLARLGADISRSPNVQIVNQQRLDEISPHNQRFDVHSELATGFPFKLSHTSALAEIMSRLLRSHPTKKGLITDLDGTLWKGSLGEVGSLGVSWSIEHRSQRHALYQQLLRALGASGVLIGIASKNSLPLVKEAFGREDILLPFTSMFPVEVNWGPKSHSVSRILMTWNISADSVVFVDDTVMELAEVKASFPEMECINFPHDDATIMSFLEHLRDLFGKTRIVEEDGLRLGSIARAPLFGEELTGAKGSAEFLMHAKAELTLSFDKDAGDARALQLVNKTNQFNLNGKRYTDGEWRSYLCSPDVVALVVSYRDKYGPLGKIAVLAGRRRKQQLFIDVWAMSCRAFSRQIEYRCLHELFARCKCEEIVFNYVETQRNEPMRRFLSDLLQSPLSDHIGISRSQLLAMCPTTFHRVREMASVA